MQGVGAWMPAKFNDYKDITHFGDFEILNDISPLTCPCTNAAAVSIVLNTPLALGLGPKEEVLLALTLLVSVMTLSAGRTTVLQGVVHLAILAVFLFLAVVP